MKTDSEMIQVLSLEDSIVQKWKEELFLNLKTMCEGIIA